VLDLYRDYFSLNRTRIRKDLLAVYVCAMILGVGSLLQAHPDFSGALVIRFFVIAVAALPVTSALVGLFHGAAALSILWVLAHDARQSMAEYLKSADYQVQGKAKLKRGDGPKLFR
jgi:hypothetical protein